MANTLFITNDLDFCFERVREEIPSHNVVIFDQDDFKVEDARKVIEKSFIASESEKYIIIKAKRYNEVSQNALLKVLEESPSNITIYLLGLSKAIFLPTIRSRVVTKTIKTEIVREPIDFDFDRLEIHTIYEFIKTSDRFMDRQKATQYLEGALLWYKKSNLKLDGDLLEFFSQGKRLIELNSNPQSVLITLFLNLLEVVNANKKNPQLR